MGNTYMDWGICFSCHKKEENRKYLLCSYKESAASGGSALCSLGAVLITNVFLGLLWVSFCWLEEGQRPGWLVTSW